MPCSRFFAADIDELRVDARCATEISPDGPDGWTKSEADPMELLAAFPALTLRVGWVLPAYQFRASGNGNGVVWAMPEDAGFPEPFECPETVTEPVRGVVLKPPRPVEALDEVMKVVEGDGSPWSYLCASIFEREASELGALWHGSSWGFEVLLDAPPWTEPPASLEDEFPPGSTSAGWTWNERVPEDWRPAVEERGEDGVTVSFFAYSGQMPEEIVRHVDRFADGSYCLRSGREPVADGPGGFIS